MPWRGPWRAVTTTMTRWRWRYLALRPAGSRSMCSLSRTPRALRGLAILSMEVTEERQRKRVPSESERRLVALTEHARDIITVAGRDGRLQYISGGIRNSMGYTVEERRSNSLFEHVHPDDVEAVQAKYGQLISGAIHLVLASISGPAQGWVVPVARIELRLRARQPAHQGRRGQFARHHRASAGRKSLAQREEVFRLATDAVNGHHVRVGTLPGARCIARGACKRCWAWSRRMWRSKVPGAPASIRRTMRRIARRSPRRCGWAGVGPPVSHSRCARPVPIHAGAGSHPAQRGRQTGARHRLLRRRLGDQAADGPVGGGAARGQDGRLGI